MGLCEAYPRKWGLYECRFCETLDLQAVVVAHRMKFHLARKAGNDVRICPRVTKVVNMRALALVLKKKQDSEVRHRLQELIRKATAQGHDDATYVGPRIRILQQKLDEYQSIVADGHGDPSSMTVKGGGTGEGRGRRKGVSSTSSTSFAQGAIDLDEIDPSMPTSQWIMDVPVETDCTDAPNYGSDLEPELPIGAQHELISTAPLFGEMKLDDDGQPLPDSGEGPSDAGSSALIPIDDVVDEPPPPPHEDDDDDANVYV